MVQARLEVTDQLGRRVVEISKDPFQMGRRVTSDLHLLSGEVSRDHAEIVAVGDGYKVRDRGSRYGTFVNGDEVSERQLAHGDRVKLGRSGGAEMVLLLADGVTEDGGSVAIGQMRQVAVLLEGLRALSSGKVLDEVLALVIDSAIAVAGAERGFIMLSETDAQGLEFKLGRSRDRKTLPGSRFETSQKIPQEVYRTGRSRMEADLLDGDLANQHMGTVALGIRNVLCVPLRLMRYVELADSTTEDRRIGVLYLDSREKGTLLDDGTRQTLDTLAAEAAVAIDNQQLIDAQKALMDSMIKVMAHAIDAKSPYTGVHCQRVPEITKMLAQKCSDSKEGSFADFLQRQRLSAPLCDVALYAILQLPRPISTRHPGPTAADGVRAVCAHLRSLGQFGCFVRLPMLGGCGAPA